MEVKINQKQLIKRAKELVTMIETNEVANNLTAKLRAVEGEIEAKEKFATEYKNKYFNRLWELIRAYNSVCGDTRDILNLDTVHSNTYYNTRRVDVVLSSEHVRFRTQLSFDEDVVRGNPQVMRDALEQVYKKMTEDIFLLGVLSERPKEYYITD